MEPDYSNIWILFINSKWTEYEYHYSVFYYSNIRITNYSLQHCYSILTITRHSQPSNSSNHLIPLRTQQPIVIIISFCGAWSAIMFYYIVCIIRTSVHCFNNSFWALVRKLQKNYIQLNISVNWVTNFGQLWIFSLLFMRHDISSSGYKFHQNLE